MNPYTIRAYLCVNEDNGRTFHAADVRIPPRIQGTLYPLTYGDEQTSPDAILAWHSSADGQKWWFDMSKPTLNKPDGEGLVTIMSFPLIIKPAKSTEVAKEALSILIGMIHEDRHLMAAKGEPRIAIGVYDDGEYKPLMSFNMDEFIGDIHSIMGSEECMTQKERLKAAARAFRVQHGLGT